MKTEHDIFYEAMLARDARFDGRFFVGVKTTGIYCRPICPARPQRRNVEFYKNRAAAEKAGFRPCLRCRPESAPLSAVWSGTSAVVSRALKMIAADPGHGMDEDGFAARFGMTARHLRRLFMREIGRTPQHVAHAARLDFARQLVVETALPMTQVALTAGFSSLRRFNDAFKKRFKRPPGDLRRGKSTPKEPSGIRLALSYRPPFNWQGMLDFYRAHRIIGIETVTADAYERVFRLGKTAGHLRVTQCERTNALHLHVTGGDPGDLFPIAQKIRQMFDLDSDPVLVANSFRAHKFMNGLCKTYPGLRCARGWDPFEAAISTILGQLVSIPQARALVGQLVRHYGQAIAHPVTGETAYVFPTAKKLASADLSLVRTTQKRKETIRSFAAAVAEGTLDLVTPQDDDQLKAQLLAMTGIGPWSAEYISLRALGSADSFPGSDLILKRATQKHPDLDLEALRPWRSYAAVYLWQHYTKALSKQKRKVHDT